MAVEPRLIWGFFDIASGAHWLIILFIGLLLFGRRLPELMKSLGGSIREFKKGMDEGPKEPPAPPSSTMEPPAPQIDGAVSRPAEPLADVAHGDTHAHHDGDGHHHSVDPTPAPPPSEPAQTPTHDSSPPDPHQHH